MSKVLSSVGYLCRVTGGRWRSVIVAVVYLVPLFLFPGFGVAFHFDKFEGIEGEATDPAHQGWSEFDTFSFGISRQAGLPGGAGSVQLTDAKLMKKVDKSSPLLMLGCCTGQHIPEAMLEYTRPTGGGDKVYMKVKLCDCLISSYSLSGGGGNSLPVDSLSLNFTKIEMTYIPYDSAGNPGAPVTAVCDIRQAAVQ